MIAQTIPIDLWQEFEEEVKRTKQVMSNIPLGGVILSKSLHEVFKKFLHESFPKGSLNAVWEKNLAIYISQNNISIEAVKEKYKVQGWNVEGLLGWMKKVQSGELTTFNILELLKWSNENGGFCKELLESAKGELEVLKDFRILSDTQLKNYEEQRSGWHIDHLIGHKKICVLAGKRSTFKSWLSLSMCYCLINGMPFLGKYSTEKTRVLYIDRENGFTELKKRAEMIRKGLSIKESQDIFYLSESSLKLDDSSALAFLKEYISLNKIGLVVVDTYRRAIRFDENDARVVSSFFVDMIQPLINCTGVSFLFIHHEKKGESADDMDKLRGSSDFANYVDGVIQLQRKGGSILVKQTKNRGGKELEPFEVKIKTDESTQFSFEYVGTAQYKQDIIAQVILDWLITSRKTSFRYTEGLEYVKVKGFSKTKYAEALNDLVEKGILSKPGGLKGAYLLSSTVLNLEDFKNE